MRGIKKMQSAGKNESVVFPKEDSGKKRRMVLRSGSLVPCRTLLFSLKLFPGIGPNPSELRLVTQKKIILYSRGEFPKLTRIRNVSNCGRGWSRTIDLYIISVTL